MYIYICERITNPSRTFASPRGFTLTEYAAASRNAQQGTTLCHPLPSRREVRSTGLHRISTFRNTTACASLSLSLARALSLSLSLFRNPFFLLSSGLMIILPATQPRYAPHCRIFSLRRARSARGFSAPLGDYIYQRTIASGSSR